MLEIRKFRVADIPRVRDMFCEAFELDCYSKSRHVMRHLLDHYLCTYLRESDYAITVSQKETIVGFLFGCGPKRHGRAIYKIIRTYHGLFLPLSRGGRAYIRCKGLIEAADRSLHDEAPAADSELMLFVVRSDLRGSGVGKTMLMEFKRWLVDNGIKDMQLSTDDYCDVDYYRRRGYTELGVRHIEFIPGEIRKFYLFTIPVAHIGDPLK